MLDKELWTILLVYFLLISGVILAGTGLDFLRRGLRCGSAFTLMWWLAYPLPTLVYLLAPSSVASVDGYRWVGLKLWSLSALTALLGWVCFKLGYLCGRRKARPCNLGVDHWTQSKKHRTESVLLFMTLGLQFYPIYVIFSRGIAINFAHRAVHWQAVGPAIRLAYFCLPSVAIAFSLFQRCKSPLRLSLLMLSLGVSTLSAVFLGARMFLILIPIMLFLMYSSRHPRARAPLMAILVAVVLILSVGYYALLRSEQPEQIGNSVTQVALGDLGRIHTLAYTNQHISWTGSELVHPRLLGSYFYWLILPIPRSSWTAKPYATNLQFSFHFRREHTQFFVPDHIADMVGTTEFGFIEEALLNLGAAGLLVVVFWGYVAARLDGRTGSDKYLGIALPMFFLLGTIYTFNGILNYMLPLLLTGFVLDQAVRWRWRARRATGDAQRLIRSCARRQVA